MERHFCLTDSVRYVRGVGPVRAQRFAALGIETLADLLEHIPFRYELRPKSVPIGKLKADETTTVVGELRNLKLPHFSSQHTIRADVVDGTGSCSVRWFNSHYLAETLRNGQVVRLTGKVRPLDFRAGMTNPKMTLVANHKDAFAGDVDTYTPVYPAAAELSSSNIRQAIGEVLHEAVKQIEDFVPDWLRQARLLPPRATALLRIHQPTSAKDVPVARRRLAYDELLLSQVAVQLGRRQVKHGPRVEPIKTSREIDRRIRRRFPFDLTKGQDQVVKEICVDLSRDQPMNRLLQADVGAGKTAVALYAALTAIANRQQAALIAPTEVLARQHHAKFEQYLSGSLVRRACLVGSTSRSQRAKLLRELSAGDIDLIVGTHALLENDVQFERLGLVIVDEQHKFGVAQRARLRQKGRAPHVLVLTATPIPRTLAMTLFGDLDVSTIHGVPPGRKPVQTRLVTPVLEDKAWAFVRSQLNTDQQAFIVYPLVEESDSLPLKAATQEVERLSRTVLQGLPVGLLHGKMKAAEKEATMARFRRGTLRALITTTVIEVGVDVPAATVMVIQEAERFGLSQLHQLRGRVGRGDAKSYCLLFTRSTNETALERLQIMCQTCDGFRVAEEDLKIRGPGELLGKRQHGVPAFKVADLLRDFDLLEQARNDASVILREDPFLEHPQNLAMRMIITQRLGDWAEFRVALRLETGD